MRLLACLIVAPQRGYDEPATLSYAISSFCPTSADGLHGQLCCCVLLVLAFGHRWSATASWFTSDKTCGERHATPWFVERLDMDCDRLLRARLWRLYDEGPLFGRLRGGWGGAVEYMKELYMKQLEHPDED